jgi:Carbohydrate esterase 2 N-terminal
VLAIAAEAQPHFMPWNNAAVYYEGRVLKQQDAAELSWPGTSVTIRFSGSAISAVLKDADTANYYNIILDKKEDH